ncbi:DUF6776 family protein [Shewanella aegiceratis]|uniref:DUF6776 family protein n=1 Tax=Shewanella aegiceratis TaxID=2864203 RepID=UPI001C65BF5D|nr:DUF6776 family protein [Shewanella aegiceratis]QYJ83401.1 hypothetical protein K0H80_05065 [Shewanella aegiceratis]
MPNYHRWVDRMQVLERKIRPSSVYLFCLVIVAFLLGVLTWDLWSANHSVTPTQSNGREAELRQALKEQAEVLASRNLELSLEREANSNMQKMFLEQHQKQKSLDRELAFYRSIMAPEHQADGVAIHGLEMTPGPLTHQYQIKLVLTQLQKRKQALKGQAKLAFVGVQQGKIVTLPLSSLTDAKFAFSFRYFQTLEAQITLPSDFELSRVETEVIVPASRWSKGAKAQQSFSAQELLATPEGDTDVGARSGGEPNAVEEPHGDEGYAPAEEGEGSQISTEPRLLLEQNSQVSDNSAQQTDVRGSND